MILKKKSRQEKVNLVERFNALGDATRFKLLNLLSTSEQICVSELASEVGISTAGVSQQLKVLEQAGLIKRNRHGQKICYSVAKDDRVNKQLFSMIQKGETR